MEIGGGVGKSDFLWTAEEDPRKHVRGRIIPRSKGWGKKDEGLAAEFGPLQPKGSTCIITRLVSFEDWVWSISFCSLCICFVTSCSKDQSQVQIILQVYKSKPKARRPYTKCKQVNERCLSGCRYNAVFQFLQLGLLNYSIMNCRDF